MNLRIILQRPFLKLKWRRDKQRIIKQAEIQAKGVKELLDKRDEIYKRYLETDKDERRVEEALNSKAQLEALDYCLGRRQTL